MQDGEQQKTNEALTPCKRRRLIRLAIMLLIVWAVAAYFLLPIAWRLATRHHPAVEGMPRITVTANGIHGDPLNIALVGTEEEVDAAMLAAGWLPADPITLRSSLRIAAGTVLRRSYDTAPVSNLFVWGRKQDLAFQQAVGNDPRRRHHVRFWKSEKVDENGRPLVGRGRHVRYQRRLQPHDRPDHAPHRGRRGCGAGQAPG